MRTDMTNIEDKLLYRLVKVAYIIVLLIGILIVGAIGWSSKPETYIDSDKSSLSCDNGKKYTLDSLGIYLITDDTRLDTYDDRRAKIACTYGVKDDYITQYKLPSVANYQVNYVNSIRGSWKSALFWWLLGFLGAYITLNLIRETLNYILFGKPFDWLWLLIPIAMMTSSNEEQTQ